MASRKVENVMFASLLWSHLARAVAAEDPRTQCERWFADPLSHPDLRRMDLRQLGDLPIDAPRADCDAESGVCNPR